MLLRVEMIPAMWSSEPAVSLMIGSGMGGGGGVGVGWVWELCRVGVGVVYGWCFGGGRAVGRSGLVPGWKFKYT